MNKGPPILPMLAVVTMLTTIGCRDQPDARVERIMQESLTRQAEQNRQIAEQNRTSAESAKRIVEAETAARMEMTQLQRELIQRDADSRGDLANLTRESYARLQDERNAIDAQRDALENERKQIARERHWEPMIAQTIGVVATLLASTVPLLLAVYVLYTVNRSTSDDRAMSEILITELVASGPPFRHLAPPALSLDHSPDGSRDRNDDQPASSH